MWNSVNIPASFWLCKWKTLLKWSYRPDTAGCMRAKLPFKLSDRFWLETTGQNLKYLPLPTWMFKHSNASVHNMPSQAFWKAKCLYFNLCGLKATLFSYFKMNSKVSIRNLLLVLLQWSHWQYFFWMSHWFERDSWYFPLSILMLQEELKSM